MYESFYKLNSGPFQLMPDPRFLFPSQSHQNALSYLMYGLQRREGFVVITGDIGIGKTLLVQRLIDEIGGSNLSVARVAMANLDADGVLPMVASAFGLPHEERSKTGLLNDLVARILPTYNRGALLIVDEAQTCTPAALEELRAISNLQARGRALLQVFLVGQTELRATLAHPSMEQLRQRIITSYHIPSLDEDELRAYVQHRLTTAGWDANPRLDEAIYPRVHAWSRGVPRRINMLMDRLLLYGYLEELHVLGEADVQIVIDELNAEMGDAMIEAPPAQQPSAVSPEENNALLDRIADLEQAFTSAVGEQRARQLLDKHECSAQQQAVVAMELRLKRLESLLSDQIALEALHKPQRASAASTSSGETEAETNTETDAETALPAVGNNTGAPAGEQTSQEQPTAAAAPATDAADDGPADGAAALGADESVVDGMEVEELVELIPQPEQDAKVPRTANEQAAEAEQTQWEYRPHKPELPSTTPLTAPDSLWRRLFSRDKHDDR